MPYVFISDGGPEAEDYDSNYYYIENSRFQESNIFNIINDNSTNGEPEPNTHLLNINQSRSRNNKTRSKQRNGFKFLIGFSKLFNHFFKFKL